jgi:uncharacterized protein (DUF58 family)
MTTHLPRIKARLAIPAHRKVLGLLEGEYASTHTGRSMDLNDLREYVRGDDVRDLEWKASARSGQLLVKRFVATRKHTVLLVVSTGRSMAALNDRQVPKRDLAVFVAGLLGWLAVRHGDFVAAAFGDATDRHLRRPSGGEAALERVLGAVHDATTTDAAPAALAAVLEHVAKAVRRRAIMVIVCDEYAVDDALRQALKRAVAQHEVLCVTVGDLDPTSDDGALIDGALADAPLADVDSGAAVPDWVRGDRRLAEEYAAALAADQVTFRRTLDRLGIAHQHVTDHDTAVAAVFRLLERHRHARVG